MKAMTRERVSVQSRLFVALLPPAEALEQLGVVLEHYEDHLAGTVSPERWHLTLFHVGEVPGAGQYLEYLSEPLPQQFMPTISLTHAGRGLLPSQLWVYAHRTPVLMNMHQQLRDRVRGMGMPVNGGRRDFVPHVRVGRLEDGGTRLGIPDTPLTVTFTPQYAHVLRSVPTGDGARYDIEGVLYLGP